jgi:hypothetical protein
MVLGRNGFEWVTANPVLEMKIFKYWSESNSWIYFLYILIKTEKINGSPMLYCIVKKM